MRLTDICCLRRILNSSYHPFAVIPKPSKWTKRERLRRFVAWQYGASRDNVRQGSQAMIRILHYANIQRLDAPRLERHYGEERLRAALAEHHLDYKTFRPMLDQAHILIDSVVLSQLAIYEHRTFKSLVNLTKSMAIQDGRAVIANENEYTEVDQDLFREPFPRHREFAKGAHEDHVRKPRKLRYDEF